MVKHTELFGAAPGKYSYKVLLLCRAGDSLMLAIYKVIVFAQANATRDV